MMRNPSTFSLWMHKCSNVRIKAHRIMMAFFFNFSVIASKLFVYFGKLNLLTPALCSLNLCNVTYAGLCFHNTWCRMYKSGYGLFIICQCGERLQTRSIYKFPCWSIFLQSKLNRPKIVFLFWHTLLNANLRDESIFEGTRKKFQHLGEGLCVNYCWLQSVMWSFGGSCAVSRWILVCKICWKKEFENTLEDHGPKR